MIRASNITSNISSMRSVVKPSAVWTGPAGAGLAERTTPFEPRGRTACFGASGTRDFRRAGTVATLEACARAIDELASHGLIAMLEPFLSSRVDGKVRNDLSPDAVIKSVHIGQGLGSTSAYTWMKLPVVDEMDRVMESTTLPTLLLGGDPADPDEAFASWEKALALPSVRGLIVGRTLLYPADDDVSSAVATAVSMVR